ncbi:MAG: FAD-binding protein [Eubacteriales bacterium]|jgi:succinate dehydrogenase/fumarate reductase flavoprotein subunit
MLMHHTVVVGTGCAGYSCADRLAELGRDVCIVTEGVHMGTSRNTGSDKQTYYKLTLSGGGADSVRDMAQTLYDGGAMDGDEALSEAAGSVEGFIRLVLLGVPFPSDVYGQYAGYKTDHDPRTRATSAGPLTSRYMTEALERSVKAKNVPVYDGLTAVKILKSCDAVVGLLCLDRLGQPIAIRCAEVVLCTGGPAGVYRASVYPESQTGSTGLAIDAGAALRNFSEWQYGLASVDFRWNVSGTYQQVLPRYLSVDEQGVEREFLCDALGESRALDMTFLKGYQWPFDVRKVDGSSVVDLLVHRECELGRRVYMDFTREPRGFSFDVLGDEARGYLERSGAMMATPIARLAHMNPKAIELYRSHGIDLYTSPLRVMVCAQHHNGGIAVDIDGLTCVPGLYAAGEAAGTLGVYRPGGSALNATQVVSRRAADAIVRAKRPLPDMDAFERACRDTDAFIGRLSGCVSDTPNAEVRRVSRQTRMTSVCAHIRSRKAMRELAEDFAEEARVFWDVERVGSQAELAYLYRSYDLLQTSRALLDAAMVCADTFGSRGAALVSDPPERSETENLAAVTTYDGDFHTVLTPVKPIPKPDEWFENVWRAYETRRVRL